MTEPRYRILEERGLIGIVGEDKRQFLQGLVSNDVEKVAIDRAVHAAFLTAQGKYLHDFFVVECNDALLLDCEAARLADLMRRLGMYKLRAKVAIQDQSERYVVAAVFGKGVHEMFGFAPEAPGVAKAFGEGIAYVDPRLSAAGIRAVLPRESADNVLGGFGLEPAPRVDYEQQRILLGLPDGSRDMQVEKAILLENGFDELNGVDWNKGCFMGQELTARTKYRGLVKKRLVPVSVEGPVPEPGTPVTLAGEEAGEIRSGAEGWALALMRLEYLERATASGQTFLAGDAHVTPVKPEWAKF